MAEQFRPATLDVPERLEAARIYVRPLDRADAPALQAAVAESREHLRPWMVWWNTHHDLSETIEFCVKSQAGWIARENFGGGIFLKGDGRIVGGAGLHPRDWSARGFEIGYWLRATATGHGYVREAAAALSRLAFESLGAERVVIRADANNHRSAHVAESLGYVLEGRHRRDGRSPDGELRDTLQFALLRAEYEQHRDEWRALLGG